MYNCIVVGTDGSETAHVAVQTAVRLAQAVGGEVAIVSAYAPVSEARQQVEAQDAPEDVQWRFSASEKADAVLESAAAEAQVAGVTAAKYAREGDATSAILAVADERNADLIVVGNRGMTGVKRFLLGSVPNKISHHAGCSVLIVRTSE
jgi:nucleotide-binding universal stress UspA family protein